MCKVEISAGSNGRTRLLIDGVDVSSWCYGFELKQNGGGIGYWKSGDGKSTRDCIIDPDVCCDFTALPFPDNSFPLVVFDPPHLTGAKETAWLVKKYGKLDENWPQMLHDGFQECMRVLKPDGVLIFKWSEYDIPAAEVWKAIGQKPLFGHHSGKRMGTFWGCFMKLEVENDVNSKAY
ncbi:methyltransferase domain-containing protein [Intestinimonas massiliensis (ex Afouda et al. 2020)]|uniref:Class I SAM-dependent methyltransferase n=1 Tax=Intestinimonas massiliensis (ex Afouda et al. 2020) TaxID=1673721 RepID=A0ABS9M989_9FIRM|nr:methyltransferase domain-containing protein [Intestinimonas massiliensis (ex Afouda et al. 2020)]MCG4526934.1 class I SAM-dependent methyltransferase [Intestinimonas massiliensis (ex Afouda et al. 2020)]